MLERRCHHAGDLCRIVPAAQSDRPHRSGLRRERSGGLLAVGAALQGGPYDEAAAAAFAAQPGASRAIAMRRWDDAAKIAGVVTPQFEHFTSIMEAALRRG